LKHFPGELYNVLGHHACSFGSSKYRSLDANLLAAKNNVVAKAAANQVTDTSAGRQTKSMSLVLFLENVALY
jgi:hypothetical protein